jgi:hypothetical protein
MHSRLRKALLVSTVGICGIVGGPVGSSLFALAPDHPLSAAALAKDGGRDGGGSDNSGSGDRGGDDRGGRDDSGHGDRGGDDRSGPSGNDDGDRSGHNASDDGDNDDNGGKSGRGHGEDSRGRGHHIGHHDGDDDDNDDNDDDDRDDKDRRGKDRGRPEAELKVSNRSLHGLLNGSLIAVDDLGRVLEVEIEFEHGTRTITVQPHRSDFRRKPGPITEVTVRPAG